ncbi:MAG TPA: DivIVA domain-containing protein [Nocardioidaceae bacterium]
MTQQAQDFPYYRSPNAIRNEAFSHRMRGLDEQEVREYLELLADQVAATELEREQLRTENRRLREEVERLRSSPGSDAQDDEISPQAVILFSQAQQVADQLVEEAVLHARDLMSSARHQQREILEQAHKAAEAAARQAAEASGREMVSSATATATDYSTSTPEIEYVRTFAQVAQVQLRSVLEALSEQVDRLGEVTREVTPLEGRRRSPEESPVRALAERTWRVEPRPPRPADEDAQH